MARAATRRTASKTPRRNGKKSNATRKRKEKALEVVAALLGSGLTVGAIIALGHKYKKSKTRTPSKIAAEQDMDDARMLAHSVKGSRRPSKIAAEQDMDDARMLAHSVKGNK